MVHLWLRAETRANEMRAPLTPEGAGKLCSLGFRISVEQSATRVFADADYAAVGCTLVPNQTWMNAPKDAIILGLKELPEDGSDLIHRHIMFGHAYKGQPAGQRLLQRFVSGGGALLDLEYLTNEQGRRQAAFGYWAGYAGAAVSLLAWAAQKQGQECPEVSEFKTQNHMCDVVCRSLEGVRNIPQVLIIGALGRVGTGAGDLSEAVGAGVTRWDMAETASGGPFPEILKHDVFLNCILAQDGTPRFIEKSTLEKSQNLGVIGDIACDPESDFNPVAVYDRVTSWTEPALRVCTDPVLDVVAIDNLPSLLPLESSQDFADQLFELLANLRHQDDPVWARAMEYFEVHAQLKE